ncbi:MAG: DegV family protein, partial [Cellulosilyticum sp.]|nr:DegV family protein [Cellulosilyticum sp.]
YYAVEAFKQGKSLEEVVSWIEQNKLKLNHWFTVADLNHLYRGGRISKTAATVGTLLQLKPILKVSEEGKLEAVEKVKGRKKSLKTLVEKVKEYIVNPNEQVIFISHADALEEAEEVKKGIMEQCQVKDVWIGSIGAAIGSHAGPGTIAVFFMGEKRA